MAYEIYAAAAAGTILRIIMADGYAGLPKFYETVDGKTKFQLNVIGTFIFSIIGAVLASAIVIQTGQVAYATPGAAFVGAYLVPHLVDRTVTKVTPNKEPEGEA